MSRFSARFARRCVWMRNDISCLRFGSRCTLRAQKKQVSAKRKQESGSRRNHDMKQRLLAPGPTPVPEETLLELAKPVFFHRTPEFRQILREVLDDLQYVFRTKNAIIPLTSSGTGALEAAVANCLPPGSKAICFIA